MDDEAPTGAKRSPFIERLVNNSDNNNKRGRRCGMGEQPSSANPSPASFCQLVFSSFLREEASPCDYKSETQDHLDSSLLDLSALDCDVQLQQSAQESRNFQHCIQLFETYNAINEDVRRAPKCIDCANVGGLEGNVTLASGWSVSYNAQQGEQGGDSFSSQLQNSGNDPMSTDHNYDGSSGDRDGSGDKNGSKEAMENEIATMDLTDDLLHLVFSFLDQKSLCCSAMVCRQWRMASAHEDFWKSLSFEGENVTKEKVGWLCRKYLKAVEFTLREVPCIDKLAREAMFSLHALRNLNLHGGILTDSFFTALANGCFALQQLSITNATLGMGGSQEVQVRHENLRQLDVIKCRVMRIAIRCPLLYTLSLKQTSMASVLLQCPTELHVLDVSSCTKLSDVGVRAAATACRNLLGLDISRCSYVSDETLREISITCKNLSALDVSHCPNISLEGVILPMLRELRLQNCEGINSTSMAALSQCFMLESIRLDGCALLTSAVLDLDRLQSLSLTNCRKCVDLTLMCPALVNINVTTCPTLQRINISSLTLKRLVLQKQLSLSTMSLQCPCLLTVDLSDCDLLSDSICKVFSDGGGCPRLVSLTLDSCESLNLVTLSSTSLEVLSLAGCRHMESLELACEKLQRLNLDGCDHLTMATFVPVGLQSLNLGICPRVTDLKIKAFSMISLDLKGCGALAQAEIYCPQLLSLDAFYCRRLEDRCLEATASSCPLIKSLILASCPSIGLAGLASLRKLLNLTVLDLSYTFLTYLSPVFENCPRLKTLRLLACKYLEDTALDSLHGKNTLPELRELDLSYGTLGQTALEGLLSQCNRLTHVNINGCANLHDLDWERKPQPYQISPVHSKSKLKSLKDLHHFRKHCEEDCDQFDFTYQSHIVENLGDLPIYDRERDNDQNSENSNFLNLMMHEDDPVSSHALQYLNCVGCPNMTKVVFKHATGFWNLLSLNLSLGSNITEVRLECLRLSSLNLSNCPALEVLDIKCPRLVSLWLQASNIEEPILQGVLRGCSALETLDVRDCSKITFQSLALVRVACPKLRRLLNSTSENNSMGF